MNRTHRLRRVAAAAALGVGAVGAAVGAAAVGTAGAAAAGARITASSAPAIPSTGSNKAAGTLTVTVPATTTGASKEITLTVSATGGGVVDWHTATVSMVGGNGSGTNAFVGAVETITVTSTTAGTITVKGITYDTTGAHGTVTVTAASSAYTFTPSTAVNAVAAAATPVAPAKGTVKATTALIGHGSDQAAGDVQATLKATTATVATAKLEGWKATTTVTFKVDPPAGNAKNCAGTSYVVFTGKPTVTVTGTTVTTPPTVTVSLGFTGTTCTTPLEPNEVNVTFTNAGYFKGTKGDVTIALSGVKYKVGSTTKDGSVTVTPSGMVSYTPAAVSNATLTTTRVTANTPAVSVPKTAVDAPISPVVVTESQPGGVAAGYVCLSLKQGSTSTANTFDPSSTATATVTSGNAKVTPTVRYFTGASATSSSSKAADAVFQVKTASTAASTYKVSGLAVNASGTSGAVTVVVTHESADNCASTTGTIGSATAYTVATSSTQVYGATADATAAAEFSRVYPSATTRCPGTRAAVIATTKTYQDALSSQFLAGDLTTGTLLTPTTHLSAVTQTMLRKEGIRTVFIVGGPLAVTTTVANDIGGLSVYNCGGKSVTSSTSGAKITVHRIYGQTQYGTAEKVAEYVGITAEATKSFAGAYRTPSATPNSSGGTGRYNDTAGKGSAAPLVPAEPTAILASGQEFQDAQSASVVSYHTAIPMLLTPATSLSTTAVAAITNLGIKQVILMGGQLAVSNTVEAALVAKTGVSVLRVSGKDYTDTARELADFEAGSSINGVGLGWTPNGRILVARGNGFTDGIAGAVLDNPANQATGTTSGINEHPLLLTESPTVVGTYLTTFLKIAGKTGIDGTSGKTITSITVLGGPLAVSPAVISDMQTDLKH